MARGMMHMRTPSIVLYVCMYNMHMNIHVIPHVLVYNT